MILVDSSAWIDYFRGVDSRVTRLLDATLGREPVYAGDLILVEVLQGFVDERHYRQARAFFDDVDIVPLCGRALCERAAENFRALRHRGVTVRKTIDTVIATFCIENRFTLLHDDRDFDPFVQHLGLQAA